MAYVYSKGVFTPTYTGADSNPDVVYNEQFGVYVRIGNLVFIDIYLDVASASGGSGAGQISGLPFPSGSSNHNQNIPGLIPIPFGNWDLVLLPGTSIGQTGNGSGIIDVSTMNTQVTLGPFQFNGCYYAD